MFSEDALVAELVERFGSQIAILYGSYARGQAGPSSDVDVVCFCARSARHPAAFRWQTLLVDAWIHPLSDVDGINDFRKLHDARVIQDTEKLGQSLLERVKGELKIARPRLDENSERHVRVWAWKMLDRAKQRGVRGDYRRHWLLLELPQVWTDLTQRHFLGPDLALDAMMQCCPELYSAFELAARSEAALSDLERVVALIVGPRVESG
ncbi:MAG TPA: nucleotidyltransferase domain-containing protein [Polyangiaceae bacterium]|jgi:predicted nucleotidyltransferase